ncbi:hypothetical protein TetV_364 [Tetraselmis virus 1]|uniref:Uncharacterized protein n=1 Tax=Tetraselmis virus 1 TaxID=2060617 RepID=A0A2P0VNH6_9VIRU|nr:hypothetical protein QJ968_gp364 [Tetraselmis virus 1]AUF82456.1 hypothetical protein TetV_364 [Tetraselmis virus 1]
MKHGIVVSKAYSEGSSLPEWLTRKPNINNLFDDNEHSVFTLSWNAGFERFTSVTYEIKIKKGYVVKAVEVIPHKKWVNFLPAWQYCPSVKINDTVLTSPDSFEPAVTNIELKDTITMTIYGGKRIQGKEDIFQFWLSGINFIPADPRLDLSLVGKSPYRRSMSLTLPSMDDFCITSSHPIRRENSKIQFQLSFYEDFSKIELDGFLTRNHRDSYSIPPDFNDPINPIYYLRFRSSNLSITSEWTEIVRIEHVISEVPEEKCQKQKRRKSNKTKKDS